MDNILHQILDLLWKNNISERDFCTSIGINKSAVTDWKKGKTTSYKKCLPEIADYFNVPIDFFSDNPINNNDRELSITDDQLKFALWGNKDIDDAVLDDVRRFAKFALEDEAKKKRLRGEENDNPDRHL